MKRFIVLLCLFALISSMFAWDLVRQAEFPANIYGLEIIGNEVWFTGSDGALGYSGNNGGSFQFLPSPLYNESTGTYIDGNDIDFINSNNGVIVGEDGLLILTTDGGQNWTTASQVATLVNGVDLETVVYHADGKIWAAGDDGYIVYSSDFGQTWTTQTSGLTDWLYGMSMDTTGTGYITCNNGSPDQSKVLKTTDFGANWQIVNLTITGNPTLYNVVQYGDSVILLGDDGYVGFSPDNGQTWTHHPTAGGSGEPRMYDAVMDGSEGYAIGWNGTVVYTDNTWTTTQLLDTDYNYHLQNVDYDSNGELFAVGWYGSVIRSSNGANWDELTTTAVDLYSMSIVDSAHWFGAGDKGFFIKTSDGGNTLEREYIPPMAGTNLRTLYSCYFKDSMEGWVSGRTDGVIYHTTDAGANWTPQQIAGVSSTLGYYEIDFINDNVGFAFGPGNLNVKTTDGGSNWTVMANSGINSSIKLYGVHIFDENNIVLGGEDGVLYRTTDGGVNWTSITVGTADIKDVLFVSSNEGIITTADGDIYYTSNGGSSASDWSASTESATDEVNHLFATSEGDIYAAGYSAIAGNYGTDWAILKSTNNGQSWAQETLPQTTFNPVRMTYIAGNDDFAVAIGENQVAYFEELGGGNENFATELFFSEYVEGDGGNNKVVEIFNGTGASVDLSEYEVKLASNGGDWNNTYTGDSMLAHNDVFVIANGSSDAPILAIADATSSITYFNGDDALGLFHNGVLIDVIGVQGEDPGTSWAVAGETAGTINHTLIRKPVVGEGTTNWALSAGSSTDDSQWIVMQANYFDDLGMHTFTGGSGEPTCAMPTFDPAAGIFTDPVNVTISSATDGAVVYYTTDGTDPDENSTQFTTPINITATTTVRARAYCDGMNPSIITSALYNFPSIIQVSTIADLRLGMQDETIYEYTGSAIVSFAQSYRNQKYIQDATGGILIDDNSGVISSAYVIGDEISGLMGNLSDYNGLTQLIPSADPGAPISSGNSITPAQISIADLSANFDSYESELIQVNNVLFADAGGTFASGANYNVSDGSASCVFRTQFYDVDYIDTTIPNDPMDIVAVAFEYNGTIQICARALSDFTPSSGNVYGTLAGLVTDVNTGNPIQDAIIQTGNYSTTSGADGSYLLENMLAGDYSVTCLANGYFSQTADVTIQAEQQATLDWDMVVDDTPAPDIIINEIMYNSASFDNEWIELYNTTDTDISISGWSMLDGNPDHDLLILPDSQTITAHGFYTIAIDHDEQAVPFPFTPDFDALAINTWNLGNSGETIYLYDSNMTLVDSVAYSDTDGWPAQADGVGPSLELIDPSMNNDLPTSWQASAADGGTPGEENSENGGTAQVSDIASMRALFGQASDFVVTGEVVISFMQDFRNQKFIQDATGAVLIDDNNGVLTSTFAVGDGITNLVGYLSEYDGMLQFIPTSDVATSSSGNSVDPVVATIGDITSDFEAYEARLVRINNVNFTNATGNFENGTVYPFSDGTNSFDFRTNFYDVNYIGMPVPVEQGDIIGILATRSEGDFIVSRDMNDLDFASANDNQHSVVNVTMLKGNYPNPFNPETNINFSLKERGDVQLTIFNLKGQKVRTLLNTSLSQGNHSVVWNGTSDNGSSVASGIYFYRLDTQDYSSSKKMILMK